MEIIVLKGEQNARKTTTLKLLYSKLKQKNEKEMNQFQYIDYNNLDFFDVLVIKGKLVGIITFGDCFAILIKFVFILIEMKVDIIICACSDTDYQDDSVEMYKAFDKLCTDNSLTKYEFEMKKDKSSVKNKTAQKCSEIISKLEDLSCLPKDNVIKDGISIKSPLFQQGQCQYTNIVQTLSLNLEVTCKNINTIPRCRNLRHHPKILFPLHQNPEHLARSIIPRLQRFVGLTWRDDAADELSDGGVGVGQVFDNCLKIRRIGVARTHNIEFLLYKKARGEGNVGFGITDADNATCERHLVERQLICGCSTNSLNHNVGSGKIPFCGGVVGICCAECAGKGKFFVVKVGSDNGCATHNGTYHSTETHHSAANYHHDVGVNNSATVNSVKSFGFSQNQKHPPILPFVKNYLYFYPNHK